MSFFQSIVDFFWGPTFNKNETKVALKTAAIRIRLQKSKKVEQNKLEKQNIIKLVQEGKDEQARIRVEYVIKTDNVVEASDILILFCEKLQSRLDLIEISDSPPEDIVEAVHTIMWASSRMDIPELVKIRQQFTLRWSRKDRPFIADLAYVNPSIMEKLSIQQPSPALVYHYFSEITGQEEKPPSPGYDFPSNSPYPPPNYPPTQGNGGPPIPPSFEDDPTDPFSAHSFPEPPGPKQQSHSDHHHDIPDAPNFDDFPNPPSHIADSFPDPPSGPTHPASNFPPNPSQDFSFPSVPSGPSTQQTNNKGPDDLDELTARFEALKRKNSH